MPTPTQNDPEVTASQNEYRRMRAAWLEEQLDIHRLNLLDLQQLIADQEQELQELRG